MDDASFLGNKDGSWKRRILIQERKIWVLRLLNYSTSWWLFEPVNQLNSLYKKADNKLMLHCLVAYQAVEK